MCRIFFAFDKDTQVLYDKKTWLNSEANLNWKLICLNDDGSCHEFTLKYGTEGHYWFKALGNNCHKSIYNKYVVELPPCSLSFDTASANINTTRGMTHGHRRCDYITHFDYTLEGIGYRGFVRNEVFKHYRIPTSIWMLWLLLLITISWNIYNLIIDQ
jgi:hypothetical protein